MVTCRLLSLESLKGHQAAITEWGPSSASFRDAEPGAPAEQSRCRQASAGPQRSPPVPTTLDRGQEAAVAEAWTQGQRRGPFHLLRTRRSKPSLLGNSWVVGASVLGGAVEEEGSD